MACKITCLCDVPVASHFTRNASAISFGIRTVIALQTLSLYRFFTSVLVNVFLLAIAITAFVWYNRLNRGKPWRLLLSSQKISLITAYRGSAEAVIYFLWLSHLTNPIIIITITSISQSVIGSPFRRFHRYGFRVVLVPWDNFILAYCLHYVNPLFQNFFLKPI